MWSLMRRGMWSGSRSSGPRSSFGPLPSPSIARCNWLPESSLDAQPFNQAPERYMKRCLHCGAAGVLFWLCEACCEAVIRGLEANSIWLEKLPRPVRWLSLGTSVQDQLRWWSWHRFIIAGGGLYGIFLLGNATRSAASFLFTRFPNSIRPDALLGLAVLSALGYFVGKQIARRCVSFFVHVIIEDYVLPLHERFMKRFGSRTKSYIIHAVGLLLLVAAFIAVSTMLLIVLTRLPMDSSWRPFLRPIVTLDVPLVFTTVFAGFAFWSLQYFDWIPECGRIVKRRQISVSH